MCRRSALALVGAAVITVSAVPQHAGAQVTQQWSAREFQDNVFGPDNAVDVAFWRDDSKNPPEEWVYMTGYQTLANGATVFATYKYDANHPGPLVPFAAEEFYPPLATNPTGTNRAVAMDVDPKTGDVYVTGESIDTANPKGLDFVVIKYDKDLVPDPFWVDTSPNDDGAIRWNNDSFNGDDRPVDISFGAHNQVPIADNAVGITGTSQTASSGLDIKTWMLNAETGDPYLPWSFANPKTKQGDAGNDDSPVGLALYWLATPSGPDDFVLHVVVAGTIRQINNGQGNEDIWTIEYDASGGIVWEGIYNGPTNGDDVATAMNVSPGGTGNNGVFVCGYTPHFEVPPSATSGGGGLGAGARSGAGSGGGAALTFADTDFIALGYDLQLFPGVVLPWFGWPDTFQQPNIEGVRVFNGPGPNTNASDDKATDIAVGEGGFKIWLTGNVREPDGVGYDIATILYNDINATSSPAHMVRVDLPTTSELAVALVADDKPLFEGAVYVTGTIQPGVNDTPLIQTFEIRFGAADPLWTRLFGNAISDFPTAIIAPTRNDGSISVMVFG